MRPTPIVLVELLMQLRKGLTERADVDAYASYGRFDNHLERSVLVVVQHVHESKNLARFGADLARSRCGRVYILPVRVTGAFGDPSATLPPHLVTDFPLEATFATRLVELEHGVSAPADLLPPCSSSGTAIGCIANLLRVGTVIVGGNEPPSSKLARKLIAFLGDLASSLHLQERDWELLVVPGGKAGDRS